MCLQADRLRAVASQLFWSGLAAIQESAHDAGSVDLDLCVHGQLAVVPCFLCQSGHGGSCLADAPVELCVK